MTVAVRPQPMPDRYQFGGRSRATAFCHARSAICANAMTVNTRLEPFMDGARGARATCRFAKRSGAAMYAASGLASIAMRRRLR